MPITRRRRANPPDQPENNNHSADSSESAAEQSPALEPASAPTRDGGSAPPPTGDPSVQAAQGAPNTQTPEEFAGRYPEPGVPNTPLNNGDRGEYIPGIESGKRTARGELFRRPPQPPPAPPQPQPASFVASAPLQAPTHEISLPLGNLLHLAYNPGFTGSEEARSLLLHQLEDESKSGGRARCWNCGSLAIAYDCWSTRSRSFGEVGIAFCEICGVWSVM